MKIITPYQVSMKIKRFKDIRRGNRFICREGHRWCVEKKHPATKEVTAWRPNFFYEHLFIAGEQIGSMVTRFRISEINRLNWEC